MQWKTQAGNITTNLKVKIFLTIPEFSATKKVTWLFNVDDSTKSKYIIVSGRYILMELGLSSIFPKIPLKQVKDSLKYPQNPWLIRVNTNLNTEVQQKVHLRNVL